MNQKISFILSGKAIKPYCSIISLCDCRTDSCISINMDLLIVVLENNFIKQYLKLE